MTAMNWLTTLLLTFALPLGALTTPLARRRETVQEAAALARGLLASSESPIGTMATLYPADHRDPSLAGQPYAMQEYYANCFANGSLALILLPISQHARNVLRAPAHGAALTVSADPPGAARARVALVGSVALLGDAEGDAALRACFVRAHPDARAWLPGDEDGAHTAYWARFDPHSVYFVGGFGDEHFIGHVPLEIYRAAAPRARTPTPPSTPDSVQAPLAP